MVWLKQSTAATVKIGPFLDDTDGKTAETALTISQADVRLSKNGGNMAQKNESSSCTHDELGYYDCAIDTTDTNTLGRLQLMVTESGALPVWHEFMVLPANVYDSLVGGSDYLQADAVEISGDSTAADKLEAVLDGMPGGAVADASPTTTAFDTDLTEATDDHYNGAFVLFYTGALTGQSRKISDYDGTNKTITVAQAFTEAPVSGDDFVILGRSE